MSETEKRENPWINILFNIFIPVIILNQLSSRLDNNGPAIALVVALMFPLGYGIYDYVTRKKKNWLSLLGLINVGLTGGMGLVRLEGIWFAVKEALFPLVIGLAVFASAFTRMPFMGLLAMNESFVDLPRIKARLKEHHNEALFDVHLRRCTRLLALSFGISSLLNFIIATQVFDPLDPSLSEPEQQVILNEQIASMTWLGFAFIALPLMFFMMGVMWYLISGIRKYTRLDFEEILLVHDQQQDRD